MAFKISTLRCSFVNTNTNEILIQQNWIASIPKQLSNVVLKYDIRVFGVSYWPHWYLSNGGQRKRSSVKL